MNAIKLILSWLCTFAVEFSAMAQQIEKTVEPIVLEITTNKTTSIIFPNSIISVDRGSKNVLAQKATGVENILQVKAASDTFPETNLTVVTADGKLSSFLVRYSRSPQTLTVSLSTNSFSGKITLSPDKINREEVRNLAQRTVSEKKKLLGVGALKSGVKVQFNGLYVKDDFIFCRIFVQNTSNIRYDIEQLRFYIRDLKQAKRTSEQEVEITPVFVENEHSAIDAKSQQTMVFVVPKFTIPDKKYFAIEIIEKNGGRNFALKVTGQRLLQAKRL